MFPSLISQFLLTMKPAQGNNAPSFLKKGKLFCSIIPVPNSFHLVRKPDNHFQERIASLSPPRPPLNPRSPPLP